MFALMILAAETVDAAEEGKVITGMLVVGLIFAGVVVLRFVAQGVATPPEARAPRGRHVNAASRSLS